MGGKWSVPAGLAGSWKREYATGVRGWVLRSSDNENTRYEWAVLDTKGDKIDGGVWPFLSDAKRSADRAFQKWFLKRELKARADFGMLYPREPMGRMFDFDTDDMLLTDLNVPPEMKAELKSYMGGLKRSPAPKVA